MTTTLRICRLYRQAKWQESKQVNSFKVSIDWIVNLVLASHLTLASGEGAVFHEFFFSEMASEPLGGSS